jgi:hypothetical protein
VSNQHNHIHRYRKLDLSRTKGKPYLVYSCIKPTCTHYLPIEQTLGKVCECNICNEPMIITKETLTHSHGGPMARPRCTGCIKRKNAPQMDAIASFLKGKV